MSQRDPVDVGDWHAESVLGSGGFGIVTLWKNRVSGESLAIKKCRWSLSSNLTQRQKERWTSEVQMMKKISNSNIVSFCDISSELKTALLKCNPSGLPLLSMEYCSLGNLRDVLVKGKHCCGLPERNVVYILQDITNALLYLHKLNITHRDVKPENVVLQTNPNRKLGVLYKLIDLGYAKEMSVATISFVGTLQYLAPEIFMRENYNHTVDYWSLGIMAFEVICGVRPFLPTFHNPLQSFKEIENKPFDIISMQFTHTGEIISRTELLHENQLSNSLKHLLEKWLRIVLQYDPHKRNLGEVGEMGGALQYLQHILSTKIITVFSVCSYTFYSYEVGDSTLFSTLEDWIAGDLKYNKDEFYLITTKKCDSLYAADFYDEDHPDVMIYAFKKGASISNPIATNMPHLLQHFIRNVKTEFKFGTLKVVYAQAVFFILQQNKHLRALIAAIKLGHTSLRNTFNKEICLFKDMHRCLASYLSEIQFYHLLFTMIKNKVNLETLLVSDFFNYISKLKILLDITNILQHRYSVLIKRTQILHEATIVVLNKLEAYNFKTWYSKAKESYYEIADSTHSTLHATSVLLNILSSILKVRDTLLYDDQLLHYIRCMTTCHKDLLKLVVYRTNLQENIYTVKNNIRAVVIKIILALTKNDTVNEEDGCEVESTSCLISKNTALWYKFQELLNSSILQYHNTLKDLQDDITY